MNISQKKAELRRKAAMLPKSDVPHLLNRFCNLPEVRQANVVMVFCGVGREPDTDGLIRTLLEQGKRVALPVCLPQRKMEARTITHRSQLELNRYGIPEPDGMCPAVSPDEVDVVLVPHLMCDRAGYRLGYGGGYYDRWLAHYKGFTVAVCPAERLVDELPRDEYDIPVKLLLLDE